MDQISMFDLMYPTFKTDNPVRLIELFAGVGSQAMALRNLGVPFEHYLMSEWEMHATAYSVGNIRGWKETSHGRADKESFIQ